MFIRLATGEEKFFKVSFKWSKWWRQQKCSLGRWRNMILLQPLNVGGIILKYEIYVMTAKRILLKVQDQQREKKSANSKQNRNKEWHRDGGKSSFWVTRLFENLNFYTLETDLVSSHRQVSMSSKWGIKRRQKVAKNRKIEKKERDKETKKWCSH